MGTTRLHGTSMFSFLRSESDSCSVCLTPCDSMDCSPPGSSVHGILKARILEWVAICFSRASPDPGIEPRSPALQADSLPAEPPIVTHIFSPSSYFDFSHLLLFSLTLCDPMDCSTPGFPVSHCLSKFAQLHVL